MKKFYFTTDVIKAHGWQRWYIEAETLEEAKAKGSDKVEFDSEEVEVTDMGEYEWEDEE